MESSLRGPLPCEERAAAFSSRAVSPVFEENGGGEIYHRRGNTYLRLTCYDDQKQTIGKHSAERIFHGREEYHPVRVLNGFVKAGQKAYCVLTTTPLPNPTFSVESLSPALT